MPDFIYLDYNATTPIDPRVADAMEPYLRGQFGNPSSSHRLGRAAKEAVDMARAQVAALINAAPEEILFSGGGSESNNAVILGIAESAAQGRRHIITSAVEHPAIVEPCRYLEKKGWRITLMPVDTMGLIDVSALLRDLDETVALVTVMLANNEVGAIMPIAEMARICRRHGVPIHSDAAQAVSKIPVDVQALGVDYLTIAGHKLYAPKGIGALFIKRGGELPPFIMGAGQESGRRAGTENVSQIVGLGAAAEIARRELDEDMAHSREMRDRLLVKLIEQLGVDNIRINGPLTKQRDACLPGTLSVSFRNLAASDLLAALAERLAASAGAACNTEGTKISAVLEAMAVPLDWARGTLRLSVGRMTNEGEIERAAALLAEVTAKMQAKSDS